MSIATSISIAIVILSLLIIVLAGFISYKKIQPTIKNVDNLSDHLNKKIDLYTQEGNRLNQKIHHLNEGISTLQENVEQKEVLFQDFSVKQEEFQESLLYLKDHSSNYSKGIYSNLKEELEEDGPKIIETFKRTFKKTLNKQKRRYQK